MDWTRAHSGTIQHSLRQCVPVLIFILAPLAVLGAAGYLPLNAATALTVHHTAHVAFPVIAFVAFVVFVAYDSSRNGLPTFSWRL